MEIEKISKPKSRKTKISKKFLAWLLGVLALLFVSWTVFSAFSYSVVYLQTGDIYFGRFLPFPFHCIFDAWVMQRDQIGQPYLSKVESMIWQPVFGAIHINPRQVIFRGWLAKNSVVLRAIKTSQPGSFAIPLFTPLPSLNPVPEPTE